MFEIRKGKRLPERVLVDTKGNIALINQSTQNNMVTRYSGLQMSNEIYQKNAITFGVNTKSFGYQMNNFYTIADVLFLKSAFLNKQNANYFIATIKKQLPPDGWDKIFGLSQMKDLYINLPTLNGQIDFSFMENFIAELEASRIAELEAYLAATGLKDYVLTKEEEMILEEFENGRFVWDNFKIGNLFDVATGRDVIIGNVLNGNIPLISHQHNDNGITKLIARLTNLRLFNFKDTIPLADRGVFLATTQNEDFHIGTRVKALTFKTGDKTLKCRLFYVTSINKLQVLFTDYSDNATDNLPNLNIALPTKNSQPDYLLMETLICAIQKLVIKEVVLYADRKIEATKSVVNH